VDWSYLTPDNAEFSETEGQLLSIRVQGKDYPVVYLHRSFPHTSPEEYISVRTIDNVEVGLIRSLSVFPKETEQLLRKHMELRYFAPSIERILEIKEEFGYSFWSVETSAGLCRFTVGRGPNVRLVASRKVLITDVDGNRFQIEDLDKLSDREYRMLEMFL
jgi:hypothetical protein